MSESGLVSRVSPFQTALRNCMRLISFASRLKSRCIDEQVSDRDGHFRSVDVPGWGDTIDLIDSFARACGAKLRTVR